MNNEKLEKNKKLITKYRDFLFSLPGFMLVGYNDNEINIDIKPEMVELARKFIVSNLEGVPIKINPRSNLPLFIA